MKRLFFLTCILLFLSFCVFGQNDRLKSFKDTSSYEGDLKEYYEKVFTLLSSGKNTPIVRYTVLPSFTPEYSFSIDKDKADNYKMVILAFSKNYWYAKNKKRVKLKKKEIAIDQELALLIKDLFDVAIKQIEETDEPIYGLDGVSYYFYSQDDSDSLVIGETWSPKDGTKMSRLVQVNEELIKYSYGKSKDLETLKKDIVALINDL